MLQFFKQGIADMLKLSAQEWTVIVTLMIAIAGAAFVVGSNFQSHTALQSVLLKEIGRVRDEVINELSKRDIKIDYAYNQLINQKNITQDQWTTFQRVEFQALVSRIATLERRCDVNCEKIEALHEHISKVERWLQNHERK